MIYRELHHVLSQNPWYLDPQWWAVVATFIASGMALFIATFGDWLKDFWKPNIQPADEPVRTNQQVGGVAFVYQRLIVKNVGSVSAKDVHVLLTYEKSPKSFIPIPLNWTHWNKSARNLPKNEPAYIDILRRGGSYPNYQFCWSFEVGFPGESLLLDFKPEFGNIRLEFFEEHGKIGNIKLEFSVKEDKLKIVN